MDTCVAIPVGGRVIPEYLIENLEQVKKSGALLYIGLDSQKSLLDNTDNYLKVKEICYEYADKVIEFESEYYYRPGGIWKKMYDCWKDSGAKYVRGLGYDDILSSEFIIEHDKFMEQNSDLDASYSNLIIRDEFKKVDEFKNTNASFLKKLYHVGRNPFSFMCWNIKFESIASQSYEDMMMSSYLDFEKFFFTYLIGLNTKHFNSTGMDSAIRREHFETQTSQCLIQKINEKSEVIKECRKITGYYLEDAIKEWDAMNFPKFILKQRVSLIKQRIGLNKRGN